MPELPEVETTVKDLRKKVLKRAFVDVWTDSKTVKKPNFKTFKKEIKGKKINNIRRRAKYILFDLSEGKTLLIHKKLTGHLLLGRWDKKLKPPESVLPDKVNTYIHLLFTLDNGKMLALSDLRKFARVELWDTKELLTSELMNNLGPEPLEKRFTFKKFKERLKGKRKIKQVLLDQSVIAGVGNIYSDEALFLAKIHPFRLVSSLKEDELKGLYKAVIRVLEKGIELRGESFADWRDIKGKKGFFDDYRKVYQREGKECVRCKNLIVRKKIGGRSTHFCKNCQKL